MANARSRISFGESGRIRLEREAERRLRNTLRRRESLAKRKETRLHCIHKHVYVDSRAHCSASVEEAEGDRVEIRLRVDGSASKCAE